MQTKQKFENRKLTSVYKSKFTTQEYAEIISNSDKDGDTTLMLLVIQEHIDLVLSTIQHCTESTLLDVQNSYGQSVLHIAVYLNQAEVAKTLISKGARIDLVDCLGRNIFHLCAEYNHLHVFQVIIQYLIRTTGFKLLNSLLNLVDYDGYTPFYLATKNENKSFCQYLVSLGVNVNAVDPKNENTVLHSVILSDTFSDQLDFAKFLIEECHVDVDIPNYFEMTAQILAEVNDKRSIAIFLQNLI